MIVLFKFTGAILITLSCTYMGFLAALRLKNREKSLAEYEGLILELKNRIIYDGREIAGLIAMIFPKDKLMLSGSDIEITDRFINGQDRRILEEFLLKLGTTEEAGETDRAQLCIEQLRIQRQKAALDYREKSNLYKTLGLCLGIFGSIIFI